MQALEASLCGLGLHRHATDSQLREQVKVKVFADLARVAATVGGQLA